jgi:molybdate transport system substrate-binding protein
MRSALVGLAALLAPSGLVADTVAVAVAANFAAPMAGLASRFESETGHEVTVVAGSTGKHYAQIVHGAPFEVYFAADAKRPRRLEAQGLAIAGTLRRCAIGRLVLCSATPGLADLDGKVLDSDRFRHLAIANPRLASYGRAAREALERLGLAEKLANRLVQGENVAQAFQMVASGNAALGFVSLSQMRDAQASVGSPVREGSFWLVPAAFHAPIEQQAVLVKDGAAARAFLEFAASDPARALIRGYGYETP